MKRKMASLAENCLTATRCSRLHRRRKSTGHATRPTPMTKEAATVHLQDGVVSWVLRIVHCEHAWATAIVVPGD